MYPPAGIRERDQARFDPVVEGSRCHLSAELSLAIWERVCAHETDGAGQCNTDRARRQFREVAARIAARGGRFGPDVGKLTRVGVEIDGEAPGGQSSSEPLTDWLTPHHLSAGHLLRPRAPGRETLIRSHAEHRVELDDCCVLALKEVLQQLAPDHSLRRDVIAAAATASRSIAGRATLWREPLTGTATPGGHAVWHAAEHRAVTLYRRAASSGAADPHDPAVESVLQRRGTGQPLPAELRREMERELGVSLATVCLHIDAVAAEAARALGAEAFTIGEDIFFADGCFAPDTRPGRKLLAHELTHVAQTLRGAGNPKPDRLQVSQPGDPLEREADAVAERIDRAAGSPPPASLPAPSALGTAWPRLRSFDTPSLAQRSQRGGAEHAPAPLAYASRAATAQRQLAIHRKTKGEDAVDKVHADFLDPDASVKNDVDVMKAALKEIKKEKLVEYNRGAGKTKIESALKTLGKSSDLTTAQAEWDALVDGRKKAKTAAYKTKQKAFFKHFETPLAALSNKYPKSQGKYWMKNTPPQILDEIFAAADSDMPADQLYAYAMKEGLIDYVRDEAGVSKTADPTASQLGSVSTTKSISGFGYLGTDDFFTELTSKTEPLTKHLPTGYDTSKLTRDPQVNEKNRTVQSAIFPNLKMGLQALSATMKRRRALFVADVATHKYATPTTDQLVYWTYVYYNAGEFNGQLKKFKGKRTLDNWIKKGEFSNAIKLLQSWQMIKEMKIF